MTSVLPYGARWILLLLLSVTQEICACVVCGTALEASRQAFIYSTALLTLAPLLMIGGLVFYLWRASHKQQQENQSVLAVMPENLAEASAANSPSH